MNRSNHNQHHISKNQALFLGAFLIIIFFTALGGWFVITARTVRVFDIKLTQLILKNDGCNYLRLNGIETKTVDFGNGCSVALPFLKNLYGSGGLITLEDKQITIADDLVLSAGMIEDLPWTPMKSEAVIMMIISTIALALIVWIFLFILKKAHNK